MTADDTEPVAQRATGRGSTSAAKAYQRRSRRESAVASGRLTRTGSPIAAALSRVPFVATIIVLLAAGIVGVLWLNTMSDAAGLRATASRIRQADLETQIQALQANVNTMQDPARLAAEASRLGLVPVGDSAMLEVGTDGRGTVIGTPTQVPGPPPPAAAPAAAAVPVPATTAAAATTALTTAPQPTAATSPVVQTTAAPVKAPETTAAKAAAQNPPAGTTAAGTTAATTARAASSPATSSPKSSPVTSSPAKSSPAKSGPAPVTAATARPTATASSAQHTTTSTGAGR